MDDTGSVSLVEGIRDLDPVPKRLIEEERTFREPVSQRLAFQVLHHQEVGTVLAADVVQGADVWMVQRRDGSGLTLESLQLFGSQ